MDFPPLLGPGKTDFDKPPCFQLLPLYAKWDGRSEEVDWSFPADGQAAEAALPFGNCHLEVTGEEPSRLHVRVIVDITKPVRLHQLEVRYQPQGGEVSRAWVPHLRPGEDLIIADAIFRSPVVLAESKENTAALVPDLSVWPEGQTTYLDYRHGGGENDGVVAHAIGCWKPSGHIFFKKTRAHRKLKAGTRLVLAHHLMRFQDDLNEAAGEAATFLWKRYARDVGTAPQVLPLARYEELAACRIFQPDLYQRFQYNGQDVAAMITQTMTSRKRPGVMNAGQTAAFVKNQEKLAKALRFIQERIFTNPIGYKLLTGVLHSGCLKIAPMASFTCWFNQVRTALGSALYARRTGDDELLQKAQAIIELALAAPTEGGCPHAVCLFPEGEVSWKRGTRAFTLIDSFHLPDAAVTGFHLLEWHQRIKEDPRILSFCEGLSKFFISQQDESGAIPAWVTPDAGGYQVTKQLSKSASTAGPAMFLAAWNRVKPDAKVLDAAKRALAFLAEEALENGRWFDYELFYSCAGRPTGEDGPDPFTGCLPENTLSMYWAARACLDVFHSTNADEHLALGRKILNRLSLYQQVLDHPGFSINTFGGFGVMNADGEHSDARQGLFVSLYMDYYRATGDAELFHRAVAALRASFTTMLTEEHGGVAPGNLVYFRPIDRGAILENYAHNGRDQVSGGYLSPDWGCGTALYASGLAFQDFSQVYVDIERKTAFGIDGCTAIFLSFAEGMLSVQVTRKIASGDKLELAIDANHEEVKRILVNGVAAELMPDTSDRYQVDLSKEAK